MILHIPHSSTKLSNFIELQGKEENLFVLTDSYTNDLFEHDDETIIFPYSRFVCDVERFIDDPMDEIGQGIIYRKDYYGFDIKRNISDEKTLEIYNFHHDHFNKKVNFQLGLYPKVVIVDCHSYWPWAFSVNNDIDICIGTDPYHTPNELKNIVYDYFKTNGYNVAINNPFNGSIVPDVHYKNNEDVYSIMIEVNKNLYYHNTDSYNRTKSVIKGVLEQIEQFEQSFI